MRKILWGASVFSLLLASWLVPQLIRAEDEQPLKGKKIALIIASQKFRDEEFKEPRDILRRAGAEIVVASSSLAEAEGMLGMKVEADIMLQDLQTQELAAVVFIGGIGASEYFDNPQAHKIAREVFRQGGAVGAICIAPVTLARAGLLQGKRATVYKSEKEKLVKAGAEYTGNPVEVDGKIVTANGPAAAGDFTRAVIKLLKR